jgi:hypothetical protein|tara:strand:- start:1924 stop:2289 length:366 start_codon:yes stop_codon:yes gene_type:complete
VKKGLNNTFIGIIAATIVMGLVIYTIEDERSILQMIVGAMFFIIPFTFISSFTSKIMSFLLMSFTILCGYIGYKMGYEDLWIGIIQSLVIGGATYFYRITKTTTFSASDYKELSKKQSDNA